MPQFSDDLFLGSAQSFVGTDAYNNFQNPSPMDLGFGPMGRVYLLDETPATVTTAAVLAAQTPTTATTYSGTQLASASATAGTSRVTLYNGTSVVQLDYPRAVSVTTGTAAASTLTSVVIAGTGGQITFTSQAGLVSGQYLTISGTLGGTGTITGYTNPTTYILTSVTTTSATLTTTAGAAVVTTAGTPTGLTYTLGVLSSNVTVSGFDYYGQPMSEIIQTGFAVSTVTSGRKAFFQVSSVAFSGATATAVSVDTTKVMGLPAKVTDPAYVMTAKFSAGTIDNTSGVVAGLGGGSTTYSTQAVTALTIATPGVFTVAYSPPSGTLVSFTGSIGSLTGVALSTTYYWTNVSSTTGNISTTQANYLAGTKVTTGGSYTASALSLVPSTTSGPTTPDVRGTYAITGTPDGSKRLLLSMGLTAIQVGPNATRAGLLGSDQA
jgi:hypothetical protein